MTTVDARQRERILDAALALMGAQGAAPTSMRQLAGACDLNVATLYHYFPSKSDLLGAVVAERGYLADLATEHPPVRATGSEESRLARLLEWIWTAAAAEDAVWKLLLGEAVRGEPVAVGSARMLTAALTEALDGWVGELLGDGTRGSTLAPLLTDVVLGGLIRDALSEDERRPADRRTRARAAAAALTAR